MEIFKWAKEIERISENLIDKAKEANLREIQTLKEEQENKIEETIQKKRSVIDLALKSLSDEVNDQVSIFESNLLHKMKKVEENYLKNKDKIINEVLKRLGFDFNG
ncbi:MAG: hypothetical protein EU531_01735 [Promethearchaeota archaeon]|nr:MAG: hypothetical protein EU531_01735 [Candidatus Lokiarchaeota archaeon]